MPDDLKLSDSPGTGKTKHERRTGAVRWSAWLSTAPTERPNGNRLPLGRGNDGCCRPEGVSGAEDDAATRDVDTKRAEREPTRLGKRGPTCHPPTEKKDPGA